MRIACEWFTAAEVAGLNLPNVPASKVNVLAKAKREGWQKPEAYGKSWRNRQGSGGGIEYHFSVLPPLARLQWSVIYGVTEPVGVPVNDDGGNEHAGAWDFYKRQTDRKKDEADRRLRALDALASLEANGQTSRCSAIVQISVAFKVSGNTLRGWREKVRRIPRHHWAAYLLPNHAGRQSTAECSEPAWDWMKSAYLRPERPNLSDCYRDLVKTAAKERWIVPSEDTLARRIKREIPYEVRLLARHGEAALKSHFPAQKRDKSMLHAMEAVNADGHMIDVFVSWPGDDPRKPIRPVLVVFQDLHSGKVLSWRVDRSENLEAVRLAFGDMVEAFGVPSHCTLDNTRTFASKRLTGGMSNRFRFKVKAEEPFGLLTTMGVKVHWATPYSGQSKPIERAFRDFASSIAKHPKFAGAYVGNNPLAKPENYGSAAVPLDVFLEVVSARINEHNARKGRESDICEGKYSFDEVFEKSYSSSIIKKASEDQRLLWLMAASDVLVKKDHIEFHGNRYWHERLTELAGSRVIVRFDPDLLHDPIHIYRLDGSYVCDAECKQAVGFYDLEAAAAHGRERRTWLKAKRAMLKAERTMSIAQVAAVMAIEPDPPAPETKVVRPVFGNLARKPDIDADEELPAFEQAFVQHARAARAARGDRLRVVEEDD